MSFGQPGDFTYWNCEKTVDCLQLFQSGIISAFEQLKVLKQKGVIGFREDYVFSEQAFGEEVIVLMKGFEQGDHGVRLDGDCAFFFEVVVDIDQILGVD